MDSKIRFEKKLFFEKKAISLYVLYMLLPFLLLQFMLPEAFAQPPALPENVVLAIKYEQRSETRTQLFNAGDLVRLNVLEKLSLRGQTERSINEIFYDDNNDLSSITTLFHQEGQQPSWGESVKYVYVDKNGTKLFSQSGDLLFELLESEGFKKMTEFAGTFPLSSQFLRFPSITDFDELSDFYTLRGFEVSELIQGKVLILGDLLEMEIDFVKKSQMYFFRNETGQLERITSVHFGTLSTGEDVPVFSETVEFGVFKCGICFQKTTLEKNFNYEIVRSEPEQRNGSKQKNATSRKISLFPNPSSNHIFLSGLCADKNLGASIQILDIFGKQILLTYFDCWQDISSKIDIFTYPAGVYIVQIRQGENVQTTQFIKI